MEGQPLTDSNSDRKGANVGALVNGMGVRNDGNAVDSGPPVPPESFQTESSIRARTTIGVGNTNNTGVVREIIVSMKFCGLSLMTYAFRCNGGGHISPRSIDWLRLTLTSAARKNGCSIVNSKSLAMVSFGCYVNTFAISDKASFCSNGRRKVIDTAIWNRHQSARWHTMSSKSADSGVIFRPQTLMHDESRCCASILRHRQIEA
jgi:hypothetical protein